MRDFNGYSYENTLASYLMAKKDPTGLMPNGETRRAWFERVHGITGVDFSEIVKQRNETKPGAQISK